MIRQLWKVLRGHRLVGEGAWVFAGSLFHALTSLIAIRAYTELARPDVYSEANLVLGLFVLTTNIFVAPIGQGVTRYYSEWMLAGTVRAAWHCANQLALSGAAIGAVIVVVGLAAFTMEPWSMLVLVVPFFAIQSWRTVVLSMINAARRQKDYALWVGGEALFSGLATVLCLILDGRPEAFVGGQLLGSAGVAWMFRRRFLREVVPACDELVSQPGDYRARLLRYGLPFVPIVVATWFIQMGERYTLSALADLETAGHYIAAAALAARPGALLAGTLTNLFRPLLFEARNHEDHLKERRVIAIWASSVLFLGLILVGMFLVFGDIFATVLLAREYRDSAAPLMGIIALGGTAYALATVAENVILASGRSAKLFLPVLSGAVVNIVAGLLWIPSLGAHGAAWSSAAGFGCELLASIWVVRVLTSGYPNASK